MTIIFLLACRTHLSGCLKVLLAGDPTYQKNFRDRRKKFSYNFFWNFVCRQNLHHTRFLLIILHSSTCFIERKCTIKFVRNILFVTPEKFLWCAHKFTTARAATTVPRRIIQNMLRKCLTVNIHPCTLTRCIKNLYLQPCARPQPCVHPQPWTRLQPCARPQPST